MLFNLEPLAQTGSQNSYIYIDKTATKYLSNLKNGANSKNNKQTPHNPGYPMEKALSNIVSTEKKKANERISRLEANNKLGLIFFNAGF